MLPLGVSALLAATGCGSEDAGTSDPQPQRQPRQSGPPPDMQRYARLERTLKERLGRDFACVAVPDDPPRMIVYVTSTSATSAARAIVKRVKVRSPVSVRQAEPLADYVAREQLRDRLRAKAPGVVAVNIQTPLQLRCPRVELMFPAEGPGVEEAERWAAETVRFYGTSRVVVVRDGLFN